MKRMPIWTATFRTPEGEVKLILPARTWVIANREATEKAAREGWALLGIFLKKA